MTGNVVITGSSSGLGAALAQALGRLGWSVVGVNRSGTATEHVSRAICGDVSDPVVALEVAQILGGQGSPAVLINCAGVGIYGPVGSHTTKSASEVLAGNLLGPIALSEAVISNWREPVDNPPDRLIINILSTAAFTPRATEAVYCAAKAGLKMYVDAARLDLKGTGIRIVNIFPGGMNTPFWERSGVSPVGFMDPAEVADVVLSAIEPGATSQVTDITVNRKS